jgi:hypothetical protein
MPRCIENFLYFTGIKKIIRNYDLHNDLPCLTRGTETSRFIFI